MADDALAQLKGQLRAMEAEQDELRGKVTALAARLEQLEQPALVASDGPIPAFKKEDVSRPSSRKSRPRSRPLTASSAASSSLSRSPRLSGRTEQGLVLPSHLDASTREALEGIVTKIEGLKTRVFEVEKFSLTQSAMYDKTREQVKEQEQKRKRTEAAVLEKLQAVASSMALMHRQQQHMSSSQMEGTMSVQGCALAPPQERGRDRRSSSPKKTPSRTRAQGGEVIGPEEETTSFLRAPSQFDDGGGAEEEGALGTSMVFGLGVVH
jgi:septal ring factor EnvC (AmiA/AmiB activator)